MLLIVRSQSFPGPRPDVHGPPSPAGFGISRVLGSAAPSVSAAESAPRQPVRLTDRTRVAPRAKFSPARAPCSTDCTAERCLPRPGTTWADSGPRAVTRGACHSTEGCLGPEDHRPPNHIPVGVPLHTETRPAYVPFSVPETRRSVLAGYRCRLSTASRRGSAGRSQPWPI